MNKITGHYRISWVILAVLWALILWLAIGEASAGEWRVEKEAPKVVNIDKRHITNTTDRSNHASATGGNAGSSAGSSSYALGGSVGNVSPSQTIVETHEYDYPVATAYAPPASANFMCGGSDGIGMQTKAFGFSFGKKSALRECLAWMYYREFKDTRPDIANASLCRSKFLRKAAGDKLGCYPSTRPVIR